MHRASVCASRDSGRTSGPDEQMERRAGRGRVGEPGRAREDEREREEGRVGDGARRCIEEIQNEDGGYYYHEVHGRYLRARSVR